VGGAAESYVDSVARAVKGRVRVHTLHQQLLEHLPNPPAAVVDVGGGAGSQSLPLARSGYAVSIVDPSPAMLEKAAEAVAREEPATRERVRLVAAGAAEASDALGGQRFAAVLCHGVLMYVERVEPVMQGLVSATEGAITRRRTAVFPNWRGTRRTSRSRRAVGGQSAGGALAVARLALEEGGPPIALQVPHYPPLDLATPLAGKPSGTATPRLRPWMGEVFDGAYVPDPRDRTDRLVSPAGPADTADLTGIAPALMITAEFDRLHAEGARYAERLRTAGALVEHHTVPKADHGYDIDDADKARETYALIARHLTDATTPG
jgi:SAM-dependent methyltransferase